MHERGLFASGLGMRYGFGFAPWRKLCGEKKLKLPELEEEITQDMFGVRIELFEVILQMFWAGNFSKELVTEFVKGLGAILLNHFCMASFSSYGKLNMWWLECQDKTLLHYAILFEKEELVAFLLRNGASPNVQAGDCDGWGVNTLSWTPLTIACFLGNASIVRRLLVHGALDMPVLFSLDWLKGRQREKTYDLKTGVNVQKVSHVELCNLLDTPKHKNIARILKCPMPIVVPKYVAPIFYMYGQDEDFLEPSKKEFSSKIKVAPFRPDVLVALRAKYGERI